MHSVPLKAKNADAAPTATVLDWCAEEFPEVRTVHGNKPCEGSLVHRLDFETEGILLAARTQAAFDEIQRQMPAGIFVKEYEAVTLPAPDRPPVPQAPFSIESGFCAFGPGRKKVQAVHVENLAEGSAVYKTEVLEVRSREADGTVIFRVRLIRGFRHQIRCHLRELGFPIANDPLYGTPITDINTGCMGLRSVKLIWRGMDGEECAANDLKS
jgi:23S rRNA pseudouridine1911/1915/1917 synthase